MSKNGSQAQNQKRTLLFDLDETLIHCVDDCSDPSTFQHLIEIKITKNQKVTSSTSSISSSSHNRKTNFGSSTTNKTRKTTNNNATGKNDKSQQVSSIVKAGINVRPFAIETLKECETLGFEVAIFTASHQQYADAVLDKLIDPARRYPRLYRQHCIRTSEGIYIKDLRVIRNRLLKDIILVDNAVYSFGFQLTNGIPILPFYKNRNDRELVQLVNYLKNHIVKAKSFQQVNTAQFKLPYLAR